MASFVPKLYYFDIPGKGEAIRLACAFSGYVIEDIRLSRDEMLAMKEVSNIRSFMYLLVDHVIVVVLFLFRLANWPMGSFLYLRSKKEYIFHKALQ